MYLNFSVKQFCLLTVNGKGRDLIGVHKFAQLQGVYVYVEYALRRIEETCLEPKYKCARSQER